MTARCGAALLRGLLEDLSGLAPVPPPGAPPRWMANHTAREYGRRIQLTRAAAVYVQSVVRGRQCRKNLFRAAPLIATGRVEVDQTACASEPHDFM
jgi:hypothetical protein